MIMGGDSCMNTILVASGIHSVGNVVLVEERDDAQICSKQAYVCRIDDTTTHHVDHHNIFYWGRVYHHPWNNIGRACS